MTIASEQARALAAYRRRIQSAVFFLMEERVCRLATEQCKYFIRAGEFGVCDGAVVIKGGPLDTGRGDAETIFSLDSASLAVAGIDVKTIMMRCDNIRGGIFGYTVTRKQLESCEALILSDPAEPDFVVFLPFYYVPGLTTWENMNEVNEKKEMHVTMPPFRPEWSLHPAPPFPSEYVPYITPVRLLGKALENMRLFIQGKNAQWINPHTGISLDVPTTGRLSTPSILASGSSQKVEALKQVEVIYKAFRRHSERFRVEFIGVRPLLGDLKLIDRVTGQELIVELKAGMCKLARQRENGAKVLQHDQIPRDKGTVFNWTRQWDFLFTALADSLVAFLIPRDRIPKDWWNSQHRVVETADDFGEYRIDRSISRQMVLDIEHVLDFTKETTNSMAARDEIPLGRCPETMLELSDDEDVPERGDKVDDGTDLLLPQRWSTLAYAKGFGSHKQSDDMRGNTYAFWQSELLWEKCRMGGQAIVLDFGIWNPRGRYGIARYQWRDEDRHRYDEHGERPARVWNFETNLPYVPLSFIQLHWTGDWAPGGTRQSEGMIKKVHLDRQSLVICQTAPVNAQRLPHGLFVVPSHCLFDSRCRNLRGVVKESEGIIDQYYAESNELIDVLTAPLRAGGEATTEFMGKTIRVADYVCDVRSTLKNGVDCVKHKHQRKARKKAPSDP